MMGMRETANKLLTRLLGNGNALVTARRRSLALNGNDQARRALVRQRGLDAHTLEILARRGPIDVTVAVARHPELDLTAARYLLRLNNPAITHVLEARFGEALGATLYVLEPSVPPIDVAPQAGPTTSIDEAATIDPPTVGAADALAELSISEGTGTNSNTASAPFDKTPKAANAASHSLIDPDSSATLATAAALTSPREEHPLRLTEVSLTADEWTAEDFSPLYTDPKAHTSTPSDASLPDAEDEDFGFLETIELFEASLNHFAPHIESGTGNAREEAATSDLHDQAAELRFFRAFQRIPKGKAGVSLLGALTEGVHAPKFHLLIELYRTGLSADEIAIAWHVRESWNSAHSDKCFLSYRDIGAIIRTFNSTPDPDEVILLLNMLLDNFRLERPCKYFYQYIGEMTNSMEQSERDGQHFPLELLASARNYN